MTSFEPARPAAPQAREVKASVLAAFQLVEDARYRNERRPRREMNRMRAERAVLDRKLAKDLRAS